MALLDVTIQRVERQRTSKGESARAGKTEDVVVQGRYRRDPMRRSPRCGRERSIAEILPRLLALYDATFADSAAESNEDVK